MFPARHVLDRLEIALVSLTIVLAFVVGTGLIGCGIVLTFLRVPGTITVRVFGQALGAPVGIGCIFLGVVLIRGVVHRALASMRR